MKNAFKLPLANDGAVLSEKYSRVVQIIIVISSGVLSSSTIATVVKAWLDNRKTKLRIQIDGERRTLEYEGYHLKEDMVAIQNLLEKPDEAMKLTTSVDVTMMNLTVRDQKGEEVLDASKRLDGAASSEKEQRVMLNPLALLRRCFSNHRWLLSAL